MCLVYYITESTPTQAPPRPHRLPLSAEQGEVHGNEGRREQDGVLIVFCVSFEEADDLWQVATGLS
jgi:hypothetical protein